MEDKYQMIDTFLNGEFSPAEVRAFEQRLLEDKELASILAFHLQMRKSARDEKKRRVLEAVELALNIPEDEPKTIRLEWYKIAAAVFLILAATLVFVRLFSGSEVMPATVARSEFRQILERERATLTVAGEAGGAERIMEYKRQLSEKAGACDYKELCYFTGIHYLFVERNYTRAIELLRCVEAPQNGGRHFRPDVPRLLVIACVCNGDTAEGIRLSRYYRIDPDSLPGGIAAVLKTNGYPGQ